MHLNCMLNNWIRYDRHSALGELTILFYGLSLEKIDGYFWESHGIKLDKKQKQSLVFIRTTSVESINYFAFAFLIEI